MRRRFPGNQSVRAVAWPVLGLRHAQTLSGKSKSALALRSCWVCAMRGRFPGDQEIPRCRLARAGSAPCADAFLEIKRVRAVAWLVVSLRHARTLSWKSKESALSPGSWWVRVMRPPVRSPAPALQANCAANLRVGKFREDRKGAVAQYCHPTFTVPTPLAGTVYEWFAPFSQVTVPLAWILIALNWITLPAGRLTVSHQFG